MTDIALIYWNFWHEAIPYNGGYLPAFPEYTVPTSQNLPYLTYTLTRNDMFENGLDQIRIWSRSTNIQQLAGFLDYVDKAVPHGGVRLMLLDNKGALFLYRGTPFVQRQPTDETDLQVGYVNILTRSHIL